MNNRDVAGALAARLFTLFAPPPAFLDFLEVFGVLRAPSRPFASFVPPWGRMGPLRVFLIH